MQDVRTFFAKYRDYILTVFVAISVALLVRSLWIEPFKIPTHAMRPNLLPGDTVFVTKRSIGPWSGWKPSLGDVVVYKSKNEISGKRFFSVKRVVGLPGDEIEFKDGVLYRNGKSTWSSSGATSGQTCGLENLGNRSYTICREPPAMDPPPVMRVPEGSYFLAADLRSQPSAEKTRKPWALAEDASIQGKARWIWISVEQGRDSVRESVGLFPAFRFDRFFRRIE